MYWVNFSVIVIITMLLWVTGILFAVLKKQTAWRNYILHFAIVSGISLLAGFTVYLWIMLERPPLRTLGETRLWYSIFLSIIGYVLYLRWKYTWLIIYSLAMSALFLLINAAHPENYDKTLMPALQSPWFIPHVIVYIIGYAFLAAATLTAIWGLFNYYKKNKAQIKLSLADNLIYLGFSFITFGLIFGALWAKEAWGHYWSWDPKETWAFITWLIYLIYIHIRYKHASMQLTALWMISLGFVILLIAWFGINYLPVANQSVHTYG